MEVRIVSLSAWGTQVLLDLNFDHWIAGCSHDALIPPETGTEIPVVTRPLDPSAPPKENPSLTEILVSPWEVDMEKLRQLRPSHLITEGALYLSGLTLEEAEEVLEKDGLPGCRLMDFTHMSVEDIWNGIIQVARTFGDEKKGENLVEECRHKMKKTVRKYGIKRNPPVMAVIREWPNLKLAGRWMSDLIRMVGAVPLLQGDDLFIHPDTYFEEQPNIFLVGDPSVSLEENRKKIASLEKEKIISVFACDDTPAFRVVDGIVFYDHSCTGLNTVLKILGEVARNDPDFSERKGVYWDIVEKCTG